MIKRKVCIWHIRPITIAVKSIFISSINSDIKSIRFISENYLFVFSYNCKKTVMIYLCMKKALSTHGSLKDVHKATYIKIMSCHACSDVTQRQFESIRPWGNITYAWLIHLHFSQNNKKIGWRLKEKVKNELFSKKLFLNLFKNENDIQVLYYF